MTDRIRDGGMPACSAVWIIVVNRGNALLWACAAAVVWVSHPGAHGVFSAVVGDRGHGEQFGSCAATVVCGDVYPGARCDELVADAKSEERVAQRGVRGHHYGGAHDQVGRRNAVSGDRSVEVGGGVTDEHGDVLGLEVELRCRIAATARGLRR